MNIQPMGPGQAFRRTGTVLCPVSGRHGDAAPVLLSGGSVCPVFRRRGPDSAGQRQTQHMREEAS